MNGRTQLNLLLILACLAMGNGLVEAMSPSTPKSTQNFAPFNDQDVIGTASVEMKTLRFRPPAQHQFSALSERPLFRQDRRPKSTVSGPVQAPSAPALRVTGIVLIAGAPRAMVQTEAGLKETLEPGSRIETWRVSEISAAGLTLVRGGQTVTYVIGEDPVTAGPARAPDAQRDRQDPSIVDFSEQIDQ